MFCLAIAFILLGYTIDIPVFSVIGAVLFIGLGMIMLNDSVEIKTGEQIQTIDNQSTTTYTYAPYDFGSLGSTSYGWIITILGVALFIIVLTTMGD